MDLIPAQSQTTHAWDTPHGEWSNCACMGYTALALDQLHVSARDLSAVLGVLNQLFAEITPKEAEEYLDSILVKVPGDIHLQ